MSIQMVCPNVQCRRLHSFPEEARGQVIKCLGCQMQFRIPVPPRPRPIKSQQQMVVEEELRVAATVAGESLL
jgi:hypothetical protein